MEQSGLDNSIISILLNLSSNTDISPRSFVNLLTLIHDMIFSNFVSFS